MLGTKGKGHETEELANTLVHSVQLTFGFEGSKERRWEWGVWGMQEQMMVVQMRARTSPHRTATHAINKHESCASSRRDRVQFIEGHNQVSSYQPDPLLICVHTRDHETNTAKNCWYSNMLANTREVVTRIVDESSLCKGTHTTLALSYIHMRNS